MIRKLLSVLTIAVIISSCGNKGNKEASQVAADPAESVKVEFTTLIENPGGYVGKNISVEGKVVHVCTHSGKKLFITGDNPDVRLFIQAGEEMPKFPMELLGSEIVVEGTLTQIQAAAIAGGEGMHSGEKAENKAGADTCETEAALARQTVLADLYMAYNKHTVVR